MLDGAPRARGAALLAVVQALGWLDERELGAVLPTAVAEVRGGGEPVGLVRPAKLVLAQG